MAIIIPSKNIYQKQNSKIIDNVIERIEIGAVEVVPDNEYDTPVYNEEIQYIEQDSHVVEQDDFDVNYEIYRGFPTGGEFIYGEAIVYSQITGKYFSGTIKIPKNRENKFIQKIYTSAYKKIDVDGKEIIEPDVKYTASCIKKVGTISVRGTINGNVSDGILKSDVIIDKSSLERKFDTNNTTSVEQLIIPIKTKNSVKDSNEFSDYDGNTQTLTVSKEIILQFDDTETNLKELTVKEEQINSEYYYVFDFKVLCGAIIDNARYTNFMEGEGDEGREILLKGETENYIPQSISITVNGDKIGIDLVDKTIYINGETAKKVHSVEGNELMQTSNIGSPTSVTVKVENFFGTIGNQKSYFVTSNSKLQIGKKYYYDSDSMYVIQSGNGGYEVHVNQNGTIDSMFSNNIEGSFIFNTTPDGEKPMYETTLELYKNGKETATILCSISDYYDYEKPSTKVISIDNSTKKMTFDIDDEVIPMVYGRKGKDSPISSRWDGLTKVFQVIGTKLYYDGAVWQELYLQECGFINPNFTDGIIYIPYSSSSYQCAGIGTAEETHIVIMPTYNGYPVEVISDNSFENTLIASLRIPKNVKTIGNYSFNNCALLKFVGISDTVTSIGRYAFRDCTSLKSVKIPNSVTSIGGSAFSGCSNLKSVYVNDIVNWLNITFGDLPANPLTYAGDLYVNDKLVTELKIPNTVTNVKNYAFRGCKSLKKVSANSTGYIGRYAFSDCANMTSFVGGYFESIEAYAFNNCGALTTVEISDNIKSIGDFAFKGCASLDHIIFTGDSRAWKAISFGDNWHDSTLSYISCSDKRIYL